MKQAVEWDGKRANVFEGPAGRARALELGLDVEWFVSAAQASELARRSHGPLAPSVAVGIGSYAAAFVGVAEPLAAKGWEKRESRGMARMVRGDQSMAIAVCTGDEGVGMADITPRSKYPRGVESLRILTRQRSLGLFEIEDTEESAEPEPDTWWLLIHSDGRSILRAELSRPVGVDEDQHLAFWSERILLDIPATDPLRQHVEDEAPLEVTVNVRAK
jgi:hypothetical protein